MNKLEGVITQITSSGNISLVDVTAHGVPLSAIIIGTEENTSYLKVGRSIFVLFKESEVSVGRDLNGRISLRNCLEGPVIKLQKGVIFSKITIDFKGIPVVSLITTRSSEKLKIEIGDVITAFIKSNEVILMDTDG